MKSVITWTASRIDVANYCKVKHYLRYVDPSKPKPIYLSVYAKGTLLHTLIESFWDRTNQILTPKWDSPEKFSVAAQGLWKRTLFRDRLIREKIEKGEKAKRSPIEWNNENEKWVILNTLPKICKPLYEKLYSEGPPLYSEVPFDFMFGKRRFKGRIDEIRLREGKVVIRDYKSGKPIKQGRLGEMKRDFDPQLTFYNAGLCSLIKDYEELAVKLGFENRKEFIDGLNVCEDFIEEFFSIEDCSIHQTKRTKQHLYELLNMIEGTENYTPVSFDEFVSERREFERGRKCDFCDMKNACKEASSLMAKSIEAGIYSDKKCQAYFNFAVPPFAQKPTIEFRQRRLSQEYAKARKKGIIV